MKQLNPYSQISVLTKPVLERSLRDILVEADGKRKDEKSEERPES